MQRTTGLRVFLRQLRSGLLRHPLRSGLIYLTFVLGFGSVLGTMASIDGGVVSVKQDLDSLGVDLVAAFNPMEPELVTAFKRQSRIDRDVVAELRAELGDDVRGVTPLRITRAVIQVPENEPLATVLVLTTPGFVDGMHAGLLAGRFLEAEDDPVTADVTTTVLDEALARKFAPEHPERLIGTTVELARGGAPIRARVVGILEDPIVLREHLDLFDAQSTARRVTARRLEFKNAYLPWDPESEPVSGVIVQAHQHQQVEAIAERLDEFFAARSIEPYVHVQKTWIDRLTLLLDKVQVFSHFLWIVDLIVMVILTSTITLLAVDERFGEVALRRVEGASQFSVVAPLVGEGMVLALLAIAPGYLLARCVLAWWVTPILQWPPVFPVLALWWLAPLLVAVGGISNLLPAWRVARLSPARVLSSRAQI